MKICRLMLFALVFAVPAAFAQMMDDTMMDDTDPKKLEQACEEIAAAAWKTLGVADHFWKMHEKMQGEKSASKMEEMKNERKEGKHHSKRGKRGMGGMEHKPMRRALAFTQAAANYSTFYHVWCAKKN